MGRTRRVRPLALLVFAGLLATPGQGRAAPQTTEQQRCINDMNKYGVRVAKSQNKADASCVQSAGRGLAFRLGVPPQAQTAQACLTNDVGGKVAKDTAKLQDREVKSCLESPEQLPGFVAGTELPLDGFFGLNPAFVDLQGLYQAGDLCFLHAAGSPDPSRSHSTRRISWIAPLPATSRSSTGG